MTDEKKEKVIITQQGVPALESFDKAASLKPKVSASLRESVSGARKVAPVRTKKTKKGKK